MSETAQGHEPATQRKGEREGEATIRAFGGAVPRVHPGAWLAPGSAVIGDVAIGDASSLWYACVVRGDVQAIRIGARTNLQDHVVVHVTRDTYPTHIGDDVTIGHRAVVHGCTVEDGAMIGIASCVLDGARIGREAWVGAGAVVTPGTSIPPRTLALGTPARVVRELEVDEIAVQRERTASYVEVARQHAASRTLRWVDVVGDRR